MRKRLPRSLIPLTALLLVAVAVWLGLELKDRGGMNPDAGGPLVALDADAVTQLEVVIGRRSFALERNADGWLMSGALADLADPGRVAQIVAALCGEETTPVLSDSGDQELDSRYGIGPDSPLTVRVADRDGRAVKLKIGRPNPVNDRYYAAGADRSGIFTVSSQLVSVLVSVPAEARSRRLWPLFARSDVDSVAVIRAGLQAPDLFVRFDDGTWWLREPADGPRRLGSVARRYDGIYRDRTRREGSMTWWRASDRTLETLLFHLGETAVREFGPIQAPAESLAAAGLAPPTVRVSLSVRGLDRRLAAAFGHGAPKGRMQATRYDYGHIMLVTGGARELLLAPLARFLEARALPFTLGEADSFEIQRGNAPPLRVRRQGEAWRAALSDSAMQWTDRQQAENLLADLVVYLDRLEIEAVLPPVSGEVPLGLGHRAGLKVWLPARGGATVREALFGVLPETEQAAVYFPADGKLLRVPASILVTFRSMFIALGLAKQ